MRDRPFSQALEEAQSLKDLSTLIDEITQYLLSLLKLDKRSLKKEDDKLIYKARLDLYCKLYRQSTQRFLERKKELNDNSHYHKTPLCLEDFLEKFTYNKSLSIDDDDDCDDFDFEVVVPLLTEKEKQHKSKETFTTLHNLEQEYLDKLIDLMNNQKKIFRRDDPKVIHEALTNSLKAFLSKFDGETTEVVLQNVYHSIRSKQSKASTDEKVLVRVGVEETSEPLAAISPVGSDDDCSDVEWEESQNVISEVASAHITTEISVTVEASVKVDTNDFGSLDKESQDKIVLQIISSNPEFKGGAIKKQLLAQGYTGVTYDNVYYSFERVKKMLK